MSILVCYHKPSPIIANKILKPILVGAKNASADTISALESLCEKKGTKLLKDNTGEHISELNPYFCELTAMYWAWKNLDADYYGLFHYRRVLDFAPTPSKRRLYKYLIPHYFIEKKYFLKPDMVSGFLQTHQVDVIIPKRKHIAPAHLSFYDTFKQDHYVQDLDKALAYIQEKYPQMADSITQVFFTKGAAVHYCNVAIWRKELYFEYCEWLFDILFTIQDSIPYQQYDAYQARVFGYLAERLFNVWIRYKEQSCHLRVQEMPLSLTDEKIFRKECSRGYERYYFLFIRVYKKCVSPPPPQEKYPESFT
ncbi:DUF4422 domain-containing protein [Helicobacter sp. MIT 05-5293]|nr:DUF4422 domain-containing protein [Helicobacter sp. MIT 05-5293]